MEERARRQRAVFDYTRMTARLLVFAAHPDDAEIGMGGTIAKLSQDGWHVAICDLTLAELSSNGDVTTRQHEALVANDILGVHQRMNLRLRDRGIYVTDPDQVCAVTRTIRQYQPDVVCYPYARDRHPDHVACSHLVKEALFNAKLRRYDPAVPAWTVERTYAYFIHDIGEADIALDISSTFDKKMRALNAYASQFDRQGDDIVSTPLNNGYLMRVTHRDALWGSKIGVSYAEGFVMTKPCHVATL
jgi:bacillithiol biosynthesis deacetylase BshB1